MRRLSRRARFEVRVSLEQARLLWQQRAASSDSFNDGLVKEFVLADLPHELCHDGQPRFPLDIGLRSQTIALLSRIDSEALDLVVAEGDRICDHVFDLLGSGPTPLGDNIDWHMDFKTGHRWNPRTYYKRIRPAPYPGGYDIKMPWELSRCQHFIRLGQAYWITDDDKYAQEFVAQIGDWIESNPWPWGVNWASTMDVALRVVNWLWGYNFFKGLPILTDEFLLAFYQSLLVHGRHIRGNLEKQGGFTNNHYLANLVGLIYLGILCPVFREATEWREYGLQELWREMFKQVYADGVGFEASIAYHRLATELFLSPIILCQLNGIAVPDEVMVRLEKMLEFVMHYTKPDGTVPAIGDADNGRLHRLKVWHPPQREWQDHRYLLAIGAVLFERSDFAQAAGDQWEEAIWLQGQGAVAWHRSVKQGSAQHLQPGYRSFVESNVHVLRGEDSYLIMDAGQVGQNGRGGHAHNDALSFELYADGVTWVTDPGTFVYTSDYDARSLFRSTSYHNTPQVLDPHPLEQNRYQARRPFLMHQDIACAIEHVDVRGDSTTLRVLLDNYAGCGLQLQRTMTVDWTEGWWVVCDRVKNGRNLSFDLRLHLGDVTATVLDQSSGSYVLHGQERQMLVCCLAPQPVDSSLEQGWVSPSYGIRYLRPVIRYRCRQSEIPLTVAFCPIDGLACRSADQALNVMTSDRIKQAVAGCTEESV